MTDYPRQQRDILRVKSLNSRHAMAENVRVWQEYVNNEINRMLDSGVTPLFRQSWMLRKGVRAQVPEATLQRLFADATLQPDPHANDAEAIRYAVADNNPTALVAHEPAASGLLAVTAALCDKWDLAARSLTLYAGRNALDAQRVGDLLIQLGMPADLVPPWVSTTGQTKATREWWLRRMWREIISTDDADNYLLYSELDVTKDTGLAISVDKARTAVAMHLWLHDSEPNSYVSNLGRVLVSRYTGFAVLGAGAFGLVLRASRTNVRFAIKLTLLASPEGTDNPLLVSYQRSELEMLRILSRPESNLRKATSMFPWLIDWTRGRMDAASVFQSLSTPLTRDKLQRGTGVYLAIVMPLFDFTLADWIEAAERASGSNADAYAVFIPMLTALLLALVAQLEVMRADLLGFQHNDIKSNNVLMQRMSKADHDKEFITLRHLPDGGLNPGNAQRVFSMRPRDTGGYGVTLSDLGMAGSQRPRLGQEALQSYDLEQLANMVPTWDFGPAASTADLKYEILAASRRRDSPLGLLRRLPAARRFFT